ncbi:hypothetical protein CRG98_041638 [Punica granatum]|uniref:Uncharacterized protein n=1 Tax=Punica granatum TaxID=22663 RepID=A0A2I0I1X0_PUNGR|nr:hypothetical protein CRG98_041638 [Punica granatum]
MPHRALTTPTEGEDAGDLNQGVVAAVKAPTLGIRRTLKLEILPISANGTTTPAITPQIGVTSTLPDLGRGTLYDLDSVQIN